jgi:hypothetical protein
MKHASIASALAVALTTMCISSAKADVWIAHDGLLERRDGDGTVVTTIPFAPMADARFGQGELDPSNGNTWFASSEIDYWGPQPVLRVVGLTPSGEEIWQRTGTGAGWLEPIGWIEPPRVVRPTKLEKS